MRKNKFLAVVLSVLTAFAGTLSVSAELSKEQQSCPDYMEIKNREIDLTEFENAISHLEKISRNPDKFSEDDVIRNAEILLEEFSDIYTLNSVYYLEFNNDVTDDGIYERLTQSDAVYIQANSDIGDCVTALCDAGFEETLRDISGYDMVNIFTYIDAETDLSEYDDENEKLLIEIEELINEYMSYTEEDFSVEYDGKTWVTSDLFSEFFYSDDELEKIAAEINKKRNETLGNIFLEIVKKRHKIAVNSGYDNFAEYAYECLFIRDYTYDETAEIYDFVKENFRDLSIDTYNEALTELSNSGLINSKYSENEVFKTVSAFLGGLDRDYLENFSHMKSHHLYSFANSSKGTGDSFTTSLTSYSVPYMYVSSAGDFTDISTVVHEFGHANAEYNNPSSAVWDLYGSALDTCEVHSQGMEILFAASGSDAFTKDENMAYLKYTLCNMISSVTQGCLFDEFQRYAYENPDCTLDELNQRYDILCDEYGIDYSPENYYEYDWVEITHNYDSPMYYISYATSAASALDLWLEAMKDMDKAKEIYNDFVENCSSYTPYKIAADYSGLSTVFDEADMCETAYQIEYFFENEEIDPNYTSQLYKDKAAEINDDSEESESFSEKKLPWTSHSTIIPILVIVIAGLVVVIVVLCIIIRKNRKKDFM